jgi:hypothetical protein
MGIVNLGSGLFWQLGEGRLSIDAGGKVMRVVVVAACLAICAGLGASIGSAQEATTGPTKVAAWPGQEKDWNGFRLYDFPIAGKDAYVVVPDNAAVGRPWVWRAQFWGNAANTDVALLHHGYHVVFLNDGDSLGCPEAMKRWKILYDLVTARGLAKKPALEGLSRGGLFVYNWAGLHPDCVGCIYGDNPVCDLNQWPRSTPGWVKEWEKLKLLYGFKSDEEAAAARLNPIAELEPIAKAGIPILHVVADADKTVNYEKNSGVLKERYRKLGGSYEEIIKHGFDHHPHGLTDCTPIVAFIMKHCGGN